MQLTKKHLSYLRRYAEAGEHGTAQQWASDAIGELLQAGCIERHRRRIVIDTLRITEKGRKALTNGEAE